MAQPTVEARVLPGRTVFLVCRAVQLIVKREWGTSELVLTRLARGRDFSWLRGRFAFPASSIRVTAVFPPSSAAGTDTRDTSDGALPFSAPPSARTDCALLPSRFSTFRKSFGKRPPVHVGPPLVEEGEENVSFPSDRGSMHWEAWVVGRVYGLRKCVLVLSWHRRQLVAPRSGARRRTAGRWASMHQERAVGV